MQTIESYLQAQGIPSRYVESKTDKEKYYLDFNGLLKTLDDMKGLFITGPVGCGKTQLVSDLMKDYSKIHLKKKESTEFNEKTKTYQVKGVDDYDPYLFKFMNVPRLLIEMRSFFDGEESTDEFLKNLKKYRILIFDDLGSEKTSMWVLEMLYVIINTRYEWNNLMIITTNLSLEEVATSVGDRTASRVAEMCRKIEMKGADKRLAKAKHYESQK